MSSQPDDESIRFRPATTADETLLTELAGRLTAFDVPPWRSPGDIATADARAMVHAARAGTAENDVLIAERGGVAVGCLHILSATDFFGTRHAHISVIATTEAAEGSGVGRALLARADAWARERGHPLLTLNVFAANLHARRFYERAGLLPELMKYVRPLATGEPGPAANLPG